MSIPLPEHARRVLDVLADLRDQDGFISPVTSVQMLDRLEQSRQAGKNLGNVVSLLDAACTETDLPWIGRLIIFGKPKNDFAGKWAFWIPFKKYIVDTAPRSRKWTNRDFEALGEVLDSLPASPENWWEACTDREALLRRVLSVVLQHARFPKSVQSAA